MCRFLCKHFTDVCLQDEFLILRQADVSKILVSYDLGQARLVNIILAYSPSNKKCKIWVEYSRFSSLLIITQFEHLVFRFEDIWRAIVTWCEYENSRKILFNDLIKHIIFGLLDPEFFTNSIINHPLFKVYIDIDNVNNDVLLLFGGDTQHSRCNFKDKKQF